MVDSAGALGAALAGGFDAWAEYRDHVVGGSASSSEGRGGPTRG
jgi:hypothetical protein